VTVNGSVSDGGGVSNGPVISSISCSRRGS